jgi:hypothetical protein
MKLRHAVVNRRSSSIFASQLVIGSLVLLAACGTSNPSAPAADTGRADELSTAIDRAIAANEIGAVQPPAFVRAGGFDKGAYDNLVGALEYVSGIKQIGTTKVTVPIAGELARYLPSPTFTSFEKTAEKRLGQEWERLLLFPSGIAPGGGPDPTRLLGTDWSLERTTISGTPTLRIAVRTFKASPVRASKQLAVVMRTFAVTFTANDARLPVLTWSTRTYGLATCALLEGDGVVMTERSSRSADAAQLKADLRESVAVPLESGADRETSCG